MRQVTPSKRSRHSSSRHSSTSSSSSKTVETSLAALPCSRRQGWQGQRQPRHQQRWVVQQRSGGRCSSPSSRRAGQAPRQHCNKCIICVRLNCECTCACTYALFNTTLQHSFHRATELNRSERGLL